MIEIKENRNIRREQEQPPFNYMEVESKAFSHDTARDSVSRGKLGRKDAIEQYSGGSSDSPYILFFQFNPRTIDDVKRNRWEMRQYAGRMGVDPIWIGGDTRTISFTLTLDATRSSLYLFQSRVYGDHETYDEEGLPTRGVLGQTELLSSFQYPAGSEAPPTEIFNRGMAKKTKQFQYPPDLVFSFGNYYITCKMTELSIKHTLFDSKLIPIRAEANITLIVKEEETVLLDTSVSKSNNNNRTAAQLNRPKGI